MMTRYDETSPESIFDYSKGLINHTLFEAVSKINPSITKEELSIGGKGGLGQLVEKFYYGYALNSNSDADFAVAGVELKTTPLKSLKSTNDEEVLAIKERLVCDMIDFCAIVNMHFEDSPFYKKCLLMLILFYLHQKDVEKHDLRFLYSVLWRLQDKDLQIIKRDYEVIVDKIKQGRAHELSEGDTMYLGACRKGQKGDSLRRQPFSNICAPQRAFSLKPAYMRTILDYVRKSGSTMATNTGYKVPDIELVSAVELKKRPFEQIITIRLMRYKGRDYKQIANAFNTKIKPSEKSRYDHATRLILHRGLTKFENAEEFKKAGISVKSIRVQKNGSVNESLSFKNVTYDEVLAAESFYDSEWFELITSRYLFVIYREADIPKTRSKLWGDESRYVLDKVFFWTMQEEDMADAEAYWNNIRENIAADRHYTEQGNTYWKIADHRKFHVRPKGKNATDLQESPTSGRKVRKVCYWFNRDYIQKIIKENYSCDWERISTQ